MEKDNVNDYEIQVESRIPNDAALIRRANKMIDDFNLYPTMPTGDLSFEFIANVTKFNPLFVLNQLRKNIIDMLMDKTDFMYDEQQFDYILNETFYKRLKSQQERILLILIDNYKVDMQRLRGTYHSYMDLRQDETVVFYYAYSIYYIAQKLENASALIFARKVLKFLELFHCEKSSTPYDGLPANGKMFSIRRFKEDKQLYNEILDLIEVAIHKYADAEDERN